jgi:hypothetical protein
MPMGNCWIFFRDLFGYWQWERHGEAAQCVEASEGAFPSSNDCQLDAIHHGYQPTLHHAIFPPEFD